MKTISELRSGNPTNIVFTTYGLKFFMRQEIDFDVWLPTKERSLQRGFVWNLWQKRELINSVLIDRDIPPFSMVIIPNPNDYNLDIFQVIDGKQRLMTLISFMEDKFTIVADGNEYFFKDLPLDYQQVIRNFRVVCKVIYEDVNVAVTDQQKIDWFRFINFAGTPQDALHLKGLE
ncbi:MAG: DUF262 domain-containing protein [Crocinitomicaceae bacterium]|nr:MAG: DUF262 domain-containing protein [Crocinitomicaceae bacterium]